MKLGYLQTVKRTPFSVVSSCSIKAPLGT